VLDIEFFEYEIDVFDSLTPDTYRYSNTSDDCERSLSAANRECIASVEDFLFHRNLNTVIEVSGL
jgi:hypothetical protein